MKYQKIYVIIIMKNKELYLGGIYMGFVVAIDGPAGSGKGTVTKIVAEKRNLVSIDTGAMYRCVALYIYRNNMDLQNIDRIKGSLDKINIEFIKKFQSAKW